MKAVIEIKDLKGSGVPDSMTFELPADETSHAVYFTIKDVTYIVDRDDLIRVANMTKPIKVKSETSPGGWGSERRYI